MVTSSRAAPRYSRCKSAPELRYYLGMSTGENALLPILWSFRRCPYAMRARLAIASAGIAHEHREILLRDKPAEMLSASPKGTVPIVQIGSRVIDESLDVMHWALGQNDPESWLDVPASAHALITEIDGPFKTALDRYKYASRRPEARPEEDRAAAAEILLKLDVMLDGQACLYGDKPRLADMAIATFVRQYAHVDLDWFEAQNWPNLIRWLADFKASERFQAIMAKHPLWSPTDA